MGLKSYHQRCGQISLRSLKEQERTYVLSVWFVPRSSQLLTMNLDSRCVDDRDPWVQNMSHVHIQRLTVIRAILPNLVESFDRFGLIREAQFHGPTHSRFLNHFLKYATSLKTLEMDSSVISLTAQEDPASAAATWMDGGWHLRHQSKSLEKIALHQSRTVNHNPLWTQTFINLTQKLLLCNKGLSGEFSKLTNLRLQFNYIPMEALQSLVKTTLLPFLFLNSHTLKKVHIHLMSPQTGLVQANISKSTEIIGAIVMPNIEHMSLDLPDGLANTILKRLKLLGKLASFSCHWRPPFISQQNIDDEFINEQQSLSNLQEILESSPFLDTISLTSINLNNMLASNTTKTIITKHRGGGGSGAQLLKQLSISGRNSNHQKNSSCYLSNTNNLHHYLHFLNTIPLRRTTMLQYLSLTSLHFENARNLQEFIMSILETSHLQTIVLEELVFGHPNHNNNNNDHPRIGILFIKEMLISLPKIERIEIESDCLRYPLLASDHWDQIRALPGIQIQLDPFGYVLIDKVLVVVGQVENTIIK